MCFAASQNSTHVQSVCLWTFAHFTTQMYVHLQKLHSYNEIKPSFWQFIFSGCIAFNTICIFGNTTESISESQCSTSKFSYLAGKMQNHFANMKPRSYNHSIMFDTFSSIVNCVASSTIRILHNIMDFSRKVTYRFKQTNRDPMTLP